MIEDKIKKMIEKPINAKGYFIDNIQYLKEDKNNFLRIFIKKEGEIEIEDCVTVCKIINPILDKEDPIEESYILDVCSSGKGFESNEQ